MRKEDLLLLKEKLSKLSEQEKKLRNLYLRKIANGELQGPMVEYSSIDKPWLKNYEENIILSDIPKCNTYQLLKEYNKDRLNEVALDYNVVSITYKELFEKIDEAANGLIAMGIKEGDTITSCIPNFPEAIYIIYAAAKIGAKIDLIDPLTNAELLAKYCNNCDSKLFFTVDIMSQSAIMNLNRCNYDKVITVSPMESLPIPNDTEKCVNFNDQVISWSTFINNGKGYSSKYVPYKKDRPFAILHTGGTTGIPKGALLSHDNINSLAFQVLNSPLNMQPKETVLNLMPPFASYGLGNGIHVHLCAGMRVRLIPSYDPSKTAEQILEFKPNRVAFTPAHVESLINNPLVDNTDLSFLHHPIVGGDTLALKTEQKINELLLKNGCKDKIAKGYGLTESCSGVSFCINNETNELQSVGVPLAKNNISVFDFDDSDNEKMFGEVGEIAILSDNNMLEYLNMPDETSKTLKRHSDGSIWLHTGDIGKIDESGRIFIAGRFRRMIIQYCGLKSNPFEAEETLIKHPLVKNAVVVGAKDLEHEQGELPVAFLEIDLDDFDKIETIKKELYQMCEEKVTYYSIPVDYIFVDSYPETSRGKIDYRKLSDSYNEMAKSRKIIPQKQLKI